MVSVGSNVSEFMIEGMVGRELTSSWGCSRRFGYCLRGSHGLDGFADYGCDFDCDGARWVASKLRDYVLEWPEGYS